MSLGHIPFRGRVTNPLRNGIVGGGNGGGGVIDF